MKLLKRPRKWLSGLHRYSRFSFRLGFGVMICLYIVALFALWISPDAASYFRAMAVYRGALEAAPASLAAGIGAGLLFDLMYRSRHPEENDGDDRDR